MGELEDLESGERREKWRLEEELERIRARVGLAAARASRESGEVSVDATQTFEGVTKELAADMMETIGQGPSPIFDAERAGCLMGSPITVKRAEELTHISP